MIEIIGLCSLGIILVVAEPMIMLRNFLGFSDEDYLKEKNEICKSIYRLITCPMCLSFWLALIWTFNPLTASIVSILADVVYKLIMRL